MVKKKSLFIKMKYLNQTGNVPAAQSLLTLSNTKNKSYDRNVVAFFVEKSSVYYI